eukprot:m.65856 g.65856  ORF g.65856 m.65856 type:complete len:903 (+) comp12076_c0_seq4:39-2747(+)
MDAQEALDNAEALLRQSPNDYNANLQYLLAVANEGIPGKLRNAREKFSGLFPMTEEMWLNWIADEIERNSPADFVSSLFARATQDYLSPTLYHQQMAYAVATSRADLDEGEVLPTESIAELRTMFEAAISAIGHHFAEGHKLWEAYRMFELNVLDEFLKVQPAPEVLAEQMQRIMELYIRELDIPLDGLEEALEGAVKWAESVGADPQQLQDAYAATAAFIPTYSALEQVLESSETVEDKVAVFETYLKTELKSELKQSAVQRVQLVYERQLALTPLAEELWLDYGMYLLLQDNMEPSLLLSVHSRGVRNLSWSISMWLQYMLCAEKTPGDSFSEVKSVLEKALAVDLGTHDNFAKVWIAFCQYCMRRAKSAVESAKPEEEAEADAELEDKQETWQLMVANAKEFAATHLAADPNSYLQIATYEIKALALVGANEAALQAAKTLLADKSRNKLYTTWSFAMAEVAKFASPDEQRQLILKGTKAVEDYPQQWAQELLQFEGTHGDVSQLVFATRIARRVARLQREQASKEAAKEAKREAKRDATKAGRKEERSRKGGKRTAAGKQSGEGPHAKFAKTANPMGAEGVPVEASEGNFHKEFDPEAAARTCIVKNISFAVDEKQLEQVFKDCGEIAEIRIVRKMSGKSKGYAFVEFKDKSSLQFALSKDKQYLDERPMLISPCVDRSKSNPFEFQYKKDLDPSTLFVKNIDYSATEDDIRELFGKFGELKQVRLVKDFSGKPRGFGYVQYTESGPTAQAILEMDKFDFKGRAMAVALSNPPKKSGDKGQPKKGVASTKEGEEAMDIANDDSPAKSSKPTRPKPSNPLLFRPSQMRTSRPVGGRKSKTNLQLTSDPPTDSTAARDGKDDSKESDAKQGGDAEKKEAKPLKKKSNADFLKLLMQGKKQ